MMSKQVDWPYVINLGNSILGVSVLAMPFCFRQTGVLLGVILLLASAWLTSISCDLLMKAAITSKRRSYEYLALHTFGPAGKLAVEVSIIGMLLGTCVAFHVVIGDLGPAIISKMLGLENTPQLRTAVMVALGLFVALPLGLLKNIESLSNVSAISIGFYMVFVAEIFTSAFPNLWSGIWVAKVEVWNPEGVFKCLPIFSMAFGCQTQLFVMYDALPEPSIKRMNTISKNAISLCTFVYLLVGFFGYVAFCDDTISGDILMNFRPTIFSEAVKLGFVLSVAVSFPLVIFPCRTSIHTLLFAKESDELGSTHESFGGSLMVPEPLFKIITITIVLGTLVVGVYLPNIEFILALTGSTMGSMICYIFPAVLFITLMSMSKNSSKSTAQLVLFLGVTILLASTYTTLNTQDQRTHDSGDSVVKIADPLPRNNVLNEDNVGAINNLNEKPHEGLDKNENGLQVKNEENADKENENIKRSEEQNEDRRQEPPNPHAPPDDEPVVKVEEKQKEPKIEQEINKLSNDQLKEKTDDHDIKDEDKTEQKIKEGGGIQDNIATEKKVNTTKQKTEKELQEAKVLLNELKEQRDEQKKLLDAQRELINELKQHQKEAHSNNQEQQKGQDTKIVDEKERDLGAGRAGSPDTTDQKKEVEEELSHGVKNAVGAAQEQQLHQIAKQNHQEMLESLDQQQQQDMQDGQNNPLDAPNKVLQQQQLDGAVEQGGQLNYKHQQGAIGQRDKNQQLPQQQQLDGVQQFRQLNYPQQQETLGQREINQQLPQQQQIPKQQQQQGQAQHPAEPAPVAANNIAGQPRQQVPLQNHAQQNVKQQEAAAVGVPDIQQGQGLNNNMQNLKQHANANPVQSNQVNREKSRGVGQA